jgi:hypothetical protein
MELHGGGKSAGGGDPGTGLEGTYSNWGSACALGFWISDATALSLVPCCRAAGSAEALQKLGLGREDAAARLPERPGEADCTYYLRTGTCAYGERCRYNHPRNRRAAAVSARFNSAPSSPPPLCFFFILLCFTFTPAWWAGARSTRATLIMTGALNCVPLVGGR